MVQGTTGYTYRWAVNPANPAQYLILSLTGSIVPSAGVTMPKDTHGGASWVNPRFGDNTLDSAQDIQVIDWDDPTNVRGYVLSAAGWIYAFGTDTPTPPDSGDDIRNVFGHSLGPFNRGTDPAFPIENPVRYNMRRFFMYPKWYQGAAYVGYGYVLGGGQPAPGTGAITARLYRWGGGHANYNRGILGQNPNDIDNMRDIWISPEDDALFVLFGDGQVWSIGTTANNDIAPHTVPVGEFPAGTPESAKNWRAFQFNWPRYCAMFHRGGTVHFAALTNLTAGDNVPPVVDGLNIWGFQDWANINFASFKNPTDVAVLAAAAYRQRFLLGNPPTLSSVAVAGVTQTTQPTVTWTYSQERGDHQKSYSVRVYDFATTQAVGFVVGQASGARWLSDRNVDVASGFQGSDRVGVNLADQNTFVAYVRVKSTADKFSEWSSDTQFTLAITPPQQPAWAPGSPLTDPDALPFGTVTLDATGWQSGNFLQFQVSVAGNAYQDVFGGSRLEGEHLVDYFEQTTVKLRYRVRQFYEAPAVIASGWSYSSEVVLEPSTVTQQSPGWRLIDPAPEGSAGIVALDLDVATHSFTQTDLAGEFQPLSRSGVIVTSAGVKGTTHDVDLWALDKQQFDALFDMLSSGHALMFQSIHGKQWYVRPKPATVEAMRAASLPEEASNIRNAHSLSLQFVEVVRPGGS